MRHPIRLSLLAALSAGLVACGGAPLGGGKQGAAQALFQASQSPGSGAKSGQGRLLELMQSGATTAEVQTRCAHGGSAKLSACACWRSWTSPRPRGRWGAAKAR